MSSTAGKIVNDLARLDRILNSASSARPLVFTNGCFDILHRGHVNYLEQAADLGNCLIVGINSDESIRRLNKGGDRPVNSLEDRAAVLAALACVDLVVPFEEDTPIELIRKIRPDHIVKGGDWSVDQIVGAEDVLGYGGHVHSIPFTYDRSTTDLIRRIRGEN